MPRAARVVFPGLPHHVVQRGNRREDVFFNDDDRRSYLDWLQHYTEKHGVEVLAYCLMTNHVHLVLVPDTDSSIADTLRPLHMRYAQKLNRNRGWKGHVWQGRYFSAALDDAYTWAAIRYVERNPVRAGMVECAEDFSWSSAAPHCGLKTDPVLTRSKAWIAKFEDVGDWATWLAEADEPAKLECLRQNVDKGLPCGSKSFVARLGKMAGRNLEPRTRGRPRVS